MAAKSTTYRKVLIQLIATPGYCVWLVSCLSVTIIIAALMMRELNKEVINAPQSSGDSLNITISSPGSSLLFVLLGLIAWYFVGIATKKCIKYLAGNGYDATLKKQMIKHLGLVAGVIIFGLGTHRIIGSKGLIITICLYIIAALSFVAENWASKRYLVVLSGS